TMWWKPASSTTFRFGYLLALCLGVLLMSISVRAQIGNATLGGTVMDPSGAAVANAELTLTNKDTGFEMKVMSNERGEYTFRNVTPGTYDLKVVKAGFQNYIQKDIVLTINQSGHADASLKLGATNETVTVEGENTLINYDNGTFQGVLILKPATTFQPIYPVKLGPPAASPGFRPGGPPATAKKQFNPRFNAGCLPG